ncbi:MAG TPA: 2-C-methyl-D-erythritol 4-phosphate cytidylyltransferase [Solirubrobacterales bacterium]|jgi:2-C-methyl-D-erythritol 4-phosphate cytidylyltransferase|nr:2-C-methyl-D-erythritol 4-phosphate cytidylyltransferase [Solirubrobacterales bacterium]HMU26750.1 2-C-methyl-D-erythritol 4-phosphate cytidylyltransferase [Solirubrobacterales bacterium]HMX70323.1 2-C-methyl-D-erythritol 4-phosphate cytidylyltransferase [Solirubrobacterales bacterium]HMY24950.1 2-C-methyl-D-erythritol 4-phosphate cytidylyltransferase [Solirubrobacterales bacterium]HNA23690.1 2-C-methyl-D-erythritol 4-phosphate cytidylyltransferase [Solirubrobacterales bacterium]
MGVPALIVAAGSGQRLGAGGPKALVELSGRPLYAWSVDAFRRATRIDRIFVAVPPGQAGQFEEPGIITVEGGETRSHSVANGLAAITADGDPGMVVVHDAARPLVSPALIDAAVIGLDSDPELHALIAAAPMTDTVKRLGEDGIVVETLDRSELVSVQTPQVFRIPNLQAAIAAGDLSAATDDASLVEAVGGSVGVIESPSGNIKVTVPADLELAALLLERSR